MRSPETCRLITIVASCVVLIALVILYAIKPPDTGFLTAILGGLVGLRSLCDLNKMR